MIDRRQLLAMGVMAGLCPWRYPNRIHVVEGDRWIVYLSDELTFKTGDCEFSQSCGAGTIKWRYGTSVHAMVGGKEVWWFHSSSENTEKAVELGKITFADDIGFTWNDDPKDESLGYVLKAVRKRTVQQSGSVIGMAYFPKKEK